MRTIDPKLGDIRVEAQADPVSDVRHTSTSEDLVYVAALLWVLVGLGLDGWAHRNRPELETFFTPWHGVFYSGFLAATAWGTWLIIKRRPLTASLREAIPHGYELSVIGLAIFAVGGIGDGFWHTIFGIETSIDALLSPTHLVMLIGMQMSGAAPLRAAWRRNNGSADSLGTFIAPLLSLTFGVVGALFFFLYANGFSNWPISRSYDPAIGEDELRAALGVLSTLATTVILLGALLIAARRWRLPFGSALVLFGLPGLFLAGLDAFESPWQLIAPMVGGLTADLLLGRTTSPIAGNATYAQSTIWRCATITPLIMWSTSTALLHWQWGVHWPPELWMGSIVMASLAGFVLALVAFPPAVPTAEADKGVSSRVERPAPR